MLSYNSKKILRYLTLIKFKLRRVFAIDTHVYHKLGLGNLFL
jgi:hypothetical protein